MNVAVFIGGNKEFVADRLGVKLADALRAQGHQVTIFAGKGKVKSALVKEYAATAKPKTLGTALAKAHTDFVVSLMNLLGCESAVEAKIPFVYAEKADFKEDKPINPKKALLKKAKKVFVIEEVHHPVNKKNYTGIKIQVVQNPAVAVEHCSYNKPSYFKRENNIVSTGKLAKESGFDTLLKAWAYLSPRHPSWHLTIAGDGTTKTSLKKFIEKNNLQASTEIVPSVETYTLLRHGDIFVFPAKEPKCADPLLDAMASTLPCIASKGTAAEAWIDEGHNGLLVRGGEEALLTVALDSLMVDWGKRVSMAVAASELKNKYPFADFVKAFTDILNK